MEEIAFLIWYMIAVLPYLIFMEGFNRVEKFMDKRGIEFTMLHLWVIILTILVITLWLLGYR